MDEFQLHVDLPDLFKDLLLQESIEDEKRLLQENGVDVDEKNLEEFHRKKEAFLESKKKPYERLKKVEYRGFSRCKRRCSCLIACKNSIQNNT